MNLFLCLLFYLRLLRLLLHHFLFFFSFFSAFFMRRQHIFEFLVTPRQPVSIDNCGPYWYYTVSQSLVPVINACHCFISSFIVQLEAQDYHPNNHISPIHNAEPRSSNKLTAYLDSLVPTIPEYRASIVNHPWCILHLLLLLHSCCLVARIAFYF